MEFMIHHLKKNANFISHNSKLHRVYVSVNPVSSDGASRVLTNEQVRASPYSEINILLPPGDHD